VRYARVFLGPQGTGEALDSPASSDFCSILSVEYRAGAPFSAERLAAILKSISDQIGGQFSDTIDYASDL
jgi:hypothetical protein